MKLLFPFVVLAVSAFGQERFEADTVVKGYVCDFKTKKLVNGEITGVGVDGTTFEILFEDGVFWLANNLIMPDMSYVLTISDPKEKSKRRFLNRTFKVSTVGIKEDDLPLINDKEVDYPTGCGRTPNVFFAKNSSQLDILAIETLTELASTLKENPTVVMEIIGRAGFYEDGVAQLSLRRSEIIVDFLMGKGIVADRLITSIQSADSAPYIMDLYVPPIQRGTVLDKNYVDSLVGFELKELARKYNSAAQFKVIRNDYVPKK
ncbi:MAG: OmpA family protein [Flavobacteriales bacterium]|nr:OmpA family protein [Flavobacteriales bacterium]